MLPVAQVTLTITLDLSTILVWLVTGALLGMLAALLLRGRVGVGLALFIGALGAFVAGVLFGLLRLEVPPALSGQIVVRAIDVVIALIGGLVAVLVLVLVARVRRPV